MKNTTLLRIAAYILLCFSVAWPQNKNLITMKIIHCSGPNIVTDKGTDHGVVQDMLFSIIKIKEEKESVVGTAKVRIIKNSKSGLKVTALNKGETVQVGDVLREQDDTQEILLSLKEAETSPVQNEDSNASLQSAGKENISPQDTKYIKSLENKVQEKEKKESHTSGLLTGVGVCCGIYLVATLFYVAGQDNK